MLAGFDEKLKTKMIATTMNFHFVVVVLKTKNAAMAMALKSGCLVVRTRKVEKTMNLKMNDFYMMKSMCFVVQVMIGELNCARTHDVKPYKCGNATLIDISLQYVLFEDNLCITLNILRNQIDEKQVAISMKVNC